VGDAALDSRGAGDQTANFDMRLRSVHGGNMTDSALRVKEAERLRLEN
jgi:hypothetical protein